MSLRMFKNSNYFAFRKLCFKKYQLQKIHKEEVGIVFCQM